MTRNKVYTKDILLQVKPEQHERLRVYAEKNNLKMQTVLRNLIDTLPEPKKTRRVVRRDK